MKNYNIVVIICTFFIFIHCQTAFPIENNDFQKEVSSNKSQLNDDFLEEIYSRTQDNTIFKFYVIDRQIVAVVFSNNSAGQQLQIDGIPQDFQTNITEEKITKIRTMLEQCYFCIQRGKVMINPRGLGGWNDDIHSGKYRKPDSIMSDVITSKRELLGALFSTIYSMQKGGDFVRVPCTVLGATAGALIASETGPGAIIGMNLGGLIGAAVGGSIGFVVRTQRFAARSYFVAKAIYEKRAHEAFKHALTAAIERKGILENILSSGMYNSRDKEIKLWIKKNDDYMVSFQEKILNLERLRSQNGALDRLGSKDLGKIVAQRSPDGTYYWVLAVEGLLGRDTFLTDSPSLSVAKDIAEGCLSVDYDEEKNPILCITKKAQGWHFNVNDCNGGTVNDSRILYSVDNLINAVENDNLYMLGIGLHPLQDMFAHTDAFVRLWNRSKDTNPNVFYAHFIKISETDAPDYVNSEHYSFASAINDDKKRGKSQRYSDAKTATYIYLYLYYRLKGNAPKKALENEIESRITGSLDQKRFVEGSTPLNRGTHGIAAFLLSLESVINTKTGVSAEAESVKQYIVSLLQFFANAKIINEARTDVITEIPKDDKPINIKEAKFPGNMTNMIFSQNSCEANRAGSFIIKTVCPKPKLEKYIDPNEDKLLKKSKKWSGLIFPLYILKFIIKEKGQKKDADLICGSMENDEEILRLYQKNEEKEEYQCQDQYQEDENIYSYQTKEETSLEYLDIGE